MHYCVAPEDTNINTSRASIQLAYTHKIPRILHTKYSTYKLRYNLEDFSSSTIVLLLMYKNGCDYPFKGSKFPSRELCGGGKPHIEAGFLNNYILHNAYNLLISEC